jgi:nitroreductase
MDESKLSAWDISETEFAHDKSPRELLIHAVRYAILAPSSHNSQPWRFRVVGDQLELYADRTRALAVIDHADRELLISCGAALFSLRVCLRNFGVESAVDLQPNGPIDDLLARVHIAGRLERTDEDRRLFWAITQRRTTRTAYEARELPDQLQRSLASAVESEGAWFWRIRTPQQRVELVELIASADREQWSDPRVRRELAAWIHPNRHTSHDGVPGYAVGLGDIMSVAAPFVMRTFDLGDGVAARDRDIAEDSPMLAVIGTEADNSRDWLMAGQALMRLLLSATAEGVRASYLNQPIELSHFRARLRDMLSSAIYPQLCLRLGYGPMVKPTPRRAIGDVLTVT